jgi:hypothetical protein
MLTALVLVCSLAATPDLRDCNEANAVDVMRVPDTFASPALCFMQGQAYVAQTVLGRELGEGNQVKVVCTPAKRLAQRAG